MRNDPLLVRVTTAALPFGSRWGIRAATAPLKRRQVRGALHALGAKPHTVVLSYLDDLFGVWGDNAVEVLRGSDDYVAGAGLMGLSARWLARLEETAVRKADIVLTVSEDLAAKWRKLGATPHLLPNGCTPVPEEYLDESEVATRGKTQDASPTVGLVGHLSSRIDIKVLEQISDSGVRLLLIGSKDPCWEPERFAELTCRESVEYLGPLPAESIPFCLRQVHVGITPYTDSDFNRASFPLKTLEYLGAGLPVVTSNLPASRWLQNDMANYLGEDAVERHLVIADSVRDFVSGVQKLSMLRSEELDRERWRFASTHSWSSRAAALQTIVEHARAVHAQGRTQPSRADVNGP
jgi:teichuronic acid biosynthesis glycosyltransferase TuaH